MLKSIKKFMEKKLPSTSDGKHSEHGIHLAAATLLIEMMHMDKHEDEAERMAVERILKEGFELSAVEVDELVAMAEADAMDAAEYYQFTSRINRDYSMPEKEKLIEYLWQVAYADGHLHRHEEHLVRKIAGLIGVSHKTFIAAKHRARDSE